MRLKFLYGSGYHLLVNAHKRHYLTILKQRRKMIQKNKPVSSEEIEDEIEEQKTTDR